MVCRPRKHLPEDMLTEVLSRLSGESLVRCRSVCKTWYQIISTKSFIKTHLEYQKSSSNTTNKYVLHDRTDLYTLLTNHESVFYETEEHSKLFYTPHSFGSDFACGDRGLRIYGVCDGLLCVSGKGYQIGDNIYLWNPICRKAKKLPELPFSIDGEHLGNYGGVSFGFYDDDYKVITIYPVDHTYIVFIYSLSTDSWKIIHTNFYSDVKSTGFLSLQPTKFVDGTSYMTTYNRMLVCYSLGDDTIRQFELPEELSTSCFEFNMEACGETIAVLGSGEFDSRYLYIWILKDKLSSSSPWGKKLVIELQETGFTNGVGFLNDGQYLISTNIFEGDLKLTKFFLCDLKSPELTEFRSQNGYPDVGFIDCNCVESLLLLDENSLSPFVPMETESTCSSTMFTLYTKNQDIRLTCRLEGMSKENNYNKLA